MRVYIAPEVAGIDALHPYLADEAFRAASIRAQIEQQAQTVHVAHSAGDSRIRMHVMCWWPGARGKTPDEVMAGLFSHDDALLTLSREYGFADWEAVRALGDTRADAVFEGALDAMLAGESAALKALLQAHPALVTARSRFGHRATLLHYIGANGVESHRQRTPRNAAEIAELLIEYGADRSAKAQMYGGGQTPHALASTSAHPYNAGVSDALNAVLRV